MPLKTGMDPIMCVGVRNYLRGICVEGGGDQALEEDTELEAMEDEEVVEGEVSVAEGMGFQEEEVAGQEQLL